MAFTARGSISVTQEGSDLPKPLSPKILKFFHVRALKSCAFKVFSSHFLSTSASYRSSDRVLFLEIVFAHGLFTF